MLTVEGYRSTGGIRGAVALSAERLYDSLSPKDRDGLRTVLLRMVAPLPSGEPIAAAVPTRVFSGSAEGPGCWTCWSGPGSSPSPPRRPRGPRVAGTRVARLRSWLEEDLDGQRMIRHLQFASDGWEALGRPPDGSTAAAAVDGARLAAGVSAGTCQAVEEFFDAS